MTNNLHFFVHEIQRLQAKIANVSDHQSLLQVLLEVIQTITKINNIADTSSY